MVADGHGNGPRRRGVPLLPFVVFVSGVVVVLGAALGSPLVLTGPRVSAPVVRPSVAPRVRAPSAPATSEAQRLAAKAASHVDITPLLVVLAVVVVGALAVLLAAWLRARRRRAAARTLVVTGPVIDVQSGDPSAAVGLRHMRRGLQRALDALSEDRDPSDAVTQAWLGLQEAAEDAGFRRGRSETPTEFTTRILRQLDVDEGALATLRRLYLGVRFGGRTASSTDVDEVRDALQVLERQWSSAPSRS